MQHGIYDDVDEPSHETPLEEQQISQTQGQHVRRQPAHVPGAASPFHNEEESQIFFAALDDIQLRQLAPAAFNLDMPYEPSEVYRTGRAKKDILMTLNHEVWFPRILLWCQALDLLKRFPMVIQHK